MSSIFLSLASPQSPCHSPLNAGNDKRTAGAYSNVASDWPCLRNGFNEAQSKWIFNKIAIKTLKLPILLPLRIRQCGSWWCCQQKNGRKTGTAINLKYWIIIHNFFFIFTYSLIRNAHKHSLSHSSHTFYYFFFIFLVFCCCCLAVARKTEDKV